MKYRVTWDIEIDADSPKAAAEEALIIQRDTMSIATVFNVYDSRGKVWEIDLDNSVSH